MAKCKDWKSIDRLPFLLAFVLLIALPILFYVFCGPYLARHGALVGIVIVPILQAATIVLLLLTRFSNPGTLPKEQPPSDLDDDFKYPLQRDVTIDNIVVKVKWCRTCNFYRPPRASHCSQCDNCVEEFDHHCPWLDNCIGAGNYRFFFLLLVTASVLILIVCAFSILVAVKGASSNKTQYIGSIVMACTTGILFLLVVSLNMFHVYLIVLGQTTNEFVGGRFSYNRNPYNRGWRKNFMRISCSAYRPMYRMIDTFSGNAIDPKVSLFLQPSSPPKENGHSPARALSSTSATALIDSDPGASLNVNLTNSDQSSQPSLLFNGSIDYVVPDTPTFAGTPTISLAGDCPGDCQVQIAETASINDTVKSLVSTEVQI
ncbi:palmitoyltransferase ZDHHC8B-like [Sycon ciliatum]|uniref:palmitoyltransferase ZDHHC8B-like n=1 Tax=Sycon ciliatum TaxID=27933 RepID=UPI0020AB10BC